MSQDKNQKRKNISGNYVSNNVYLEAVNNLILMMLPQTHLTHLSVP